MGDSTRYFQIPPLPSSDEPTDIVSRSAKFRSFMMQLSSQCWTYYECNNHKSKRRSVSLYLGSLGPCAFLRYRLASSLSWKKSPQESEQKRKLLWDGVRTVESTLRSSSRRKQETVTLLEGDRVGSYALQAALYYALSPAMEREGSTAMICDAKCRLLGIGSDIVRSLPRGECEILYGRAGYLQAIAFVRTETNDSNFGRNLVKEIAASILVEGERLAKIRRINMPFLWEWHHEIYLGAAHGVVGILFTLLHFEEEVAHIYVGDEKKGTLELIQDMIWKLDDVCFDSGNIKPSLDDPDDADELVHFCHGAPGHILLLIKAHEVFKDFEFLKRAEDITRKVICCRGLLKKGVGLCHGISGNAYCFLALYRGWLVEESQRKKELSSPTKAKPQKKAHTSFNRGTEWLQWAYHFAAFAVDNFNDLKGKPDHPFSLYEGIGGFIALLHDLDQPEQSFFPCFEMSKRIES